MGLVSKTILIAAVRAHSYLLEHILFVFRLKLSFPFVLGLSQPPLIRRLAVCNSATCADALLYASYNWLTAIAEYVFEECEQESSRVE